MRHERRSFQEWKAIFCSTILLLFQSVSATEPQECLDPLGEMGDCIKLLDCPELLLLLRNPTYTNIRFLQEATCDTTSYHPKACCKRQKVTTEATKLPSKSITKLILEPDDDIKSHPNFKLLPSIEDCGKESYTDKIIGGTDAGLGSNPWMVLIGFQGRDNNIQLSCGGTLITNRYVLTAAHCVTQLPRPFTVKLVRVGEYDQRSNPDCLGKTCAPPYQDIPVKKIVFYQDYNKNEKKEHDIALIRLASPAQFGSFIKPICLPTGERYLKTTKSYVAGWGRTTLFSKQGSQVLQVVTLQPNPQEICKDKYNTLDIDDSRFCAGGEKGKDSCKGDSGGPLMMALPVEGTFGFRVVQLGIVSIGPPICGTEGTPAIYTRVAYYMSWILDHLEP